MSLTLAGTLQKCASLIPTGPVVNLLAVYTGNRRRGGCLRGEIRRFVNDHPGLRLLACPEAAGVNITATMASIGVALEWPPVTKALQIVLAGTTALAAIPKP